MASVNRGKRLRSLSVDEYRALLRNQILRNSMKSESNCWLWTGRRQSNGYASTRMYGKNTPAHRAAYFAFTGCIENGAEVCHRCDVRYCVNPDHLFLAGHAENMKDMSVKGRGRNGVMSGAYKPIRGEGGRFIKRVEK